MTRPSQQNEFEQLEAGVAQGRLKHIPRLGEALRDFRAEVDAIRAQPLIEPEKRHRIAQAEAALRRTVASVTAEARTVALRELDQREGQLRASMRADGTRSDADVQRDAWRAAKVPLFAFRVEGASTVGALLDLFDEVQMTHDDELVSLVGARVLTRLETLGMSEKHKNATPIRNATEQFRQVFMTWQREHPSPMQQLAEIERARGQAALLFDASAEFALALFGIGRPVSAPSALTEMPEPIAPRRGLVVGGFWDRMPGRK